MVVSTSIGQTPLEGPAVDLVKAPAVRFQALDSLRGICALLVCVFHFRVSSPIFFSRLVQESWAFVDFFFVLSGFVIALNYRSRLLNAFGLKAFIGLRFFRLYPLHFFIIVIMVVFEILGMTLFSGVMSREQFSGPFSLRFLGLNLIFAQSFGILPGVSWNMPSWSIATEFWTYGLFGLALLTAREGLDKLLFLVIPACMIILVAATPLGIAVTWDWGMVRCVLGFSVGVCCYFAWSRWQHVCPTFSQKVWSAVEIAMIALVTLAVIYIAESSINVLLPFIFAAAVFVFAYEGGAISRLLKRGPMLMLGSFSYSIYMIHDFVQARLEDLVRILNIERFERVFLPNTANVAASPDASSLDAMVLTMLMLFAVVAGSYFTYRLVETPGNQLGRRLFGSGSNRFSNSSK